MTCAPCRQARQQFTESVRARNLGGALAAVRRGAAIAADKARGVDVDAKYGTPPPPPFRAPYRSPWRRHP